MCQKRSIVSLTGIWKNNVKIFYTYTIKKHTRELPFVSKDNANVEKKTSKDTGVPSDLLLVASDDSCNDLGAK